VFEVVPECTLTVLPAGAQVVATPLDRACSSQPLGCGPFWILVRQAAPGPQLLGLGRGMYDNNDTPVIALPCNDGNGALVPLAFFLVVA
jgi:hypothetical protein